MVISKYDCMNGKKHQTYNIDALVRSWKNGLGLLGLHDNDKVFIEIEYFGGFEYFNTRPYHNYENWGHGWRVRILACDYTNVKTGEEDRVGVIDLDPPIEVTSECLVCAMEKALKELNDV
jgi:hypothetical protein